MNGLFAGDFSDSDMVNYARTITDKTMENQAVVEQIKVNTPEQAMLGDFPAIITDAIIGSMDSHSAMAEQVLSNKQIQQGFARLVLDLVYKRINV